MATVRESGEEDEFTQILSFFPSIITEHVESGFDNLVAIWLDPGEKMKLYNKYQVK